MGVWCFLLVFVVWMVSLFVGLGWFCCFFCLEVAARATAFEYLILFALLIGCVDFIVCFVSFGFCCCFLCACSCVLVVVSLMNACVCDFVCEGCICVFKFDLLFCVLLISL